MNLWERGNCCGNSCGNWKNRGFARVCGIYKREFPQFPHNIYILDVYPYTLCIYRV